MHPHLTNGRLRLGEVQWGSGSANNQIVLTPGRGCSVLPGGHPQAQQSTRSTWRSPLHPRHHREGSNLQGTAWPISGRSRREHEPKLPGRKVVPAWRPPRNQPLHKGPGLLTLPQARLPLTTFPTTLGQHCVAKSCSFLQMTKLRLRKTSSPSRCHVACQG